ncbi:unnamed protein product, partial [Heterotrigona itama]
FEYFTRQLALHVNDRNSETVSLTNVQDEPLLNSQVTILEKKENGAICTEPELNYAHTKSR